MKSFLKHVFSTVVGIMVFMSISMFLAIIAITGMLASESKLPEVKSNSVMTIKLCGFIQERGTDNGLPFMKFMYQDMETQGLDQLTEAIEKAKDNEHIKGIYIEAGPASFDSPATMIALRRSLNAFKKSNGKLFPFGAFRVLHAMKHSDQLDLLLIGVKPSMQGSAINLIMMNKGVCSCIKNGIKFAETGPMLETNEAILSQWKRFDKIQHKRRRCFIKSLIPSDTSAN